MNKTQILYIMQNGNTSQYKIGITNDLNKRHASLQTGCPEDLHIIKIYTHYDRKKILYYERVLHRYYTKCGCRLRANGEWFDLSIADINFLCKPKGIKEQNELMETLKEMM